MSVSELNKERGGGGKLVGLGGGGGIKNASITNFLLFTYSPLPAPFPPKNELLERESGENPGRRRGSWVIVLPLLPPLTPSIQLYQLFNPPSLPSIHPWTSLLRGGGSGGVASCFPPFASVLPLHYSSAL